MPYSAQARGSFRRKLPFISGGGGGGGAGGTPNAIELIQASGGDFEKTFAIANLTYNRFYLSLWYQHPAGTEENKPGGGFRLTSDATNVIHVAAPVNALNVPDEAHVRVSIAVDDGAGFWNTNNTEARTNVSASGLQKWKHVLVEYDSTEAVQADRVKIYINDTKLTAFSLPVDNDLNRTIYGNSTGEKCEIEQGQHVGCTVVSDFNLQVKGFWFKLATSNLFDFDVAATRHNFITAGLAYIQHASVMGGQTADLWGEGKKSDWTGWTAIATVNDYIAGSPVAS